ncbi:MAG: family 43 glycosylhydrolase [Lachnospiraceae bacterium]|nr:family 43 glycosylhydrolase [Lachnospiraceae bacterium]
MEITAKKNPIISRRGVCDPHVHIFRGRAYLYASHDCFDGSDSGDFDHMDDWEIWSSADLVTWTRESVVTPTDTPIGETHYCWAVDAAEKNGKFYLYVSNHVWETYVLVSDDPGKGFVPARKTPLLPRDLTPTRSYDPGVFTDDDGSSYIVFGTPVWAGGDSYYIARLNDDMISLAEAPKKLMLNDIADDKPFLHKHGGTYYLSWASFYATADNVYGPYTYRGNIGLTYDHGSFFEWNGQQFMAFTVNESLNQPRRASGLAYIHYRESGEIVSDTLIREYGVGQYRAEWNQIECAWYMKGEKVQKQTNAFSRFEVCAEDGGFVEFPNIQGMEENAVLMLHCRGMADSEITVFADGNRIGTIEVGDSSDSLSTFACYREHMLPLGLSAGTHTLRFEVRGLIHLNYFRLIT